MKRSEDAKTCERPIGERVVQEAAEKGAAYLQIQGTIVATSLQFSKLARAADARFSLSLSLLSLCTEQIAEIWFDFVSFAT